MLEYRRRNGYNARMSVQIMGILNTSPDSFNGDGVSNDDELRARLHELVEAGADIIDVGGQSTRPGAEVISVEEELRRTILAIRLTRKLTDVPISVDTFKPEVAKAALEAGATIINDVHGCEDPTMVKLLKFSDAKVVVMHSRGNSKTMSGLTDYPNGVVQEVVEFFEERTAELIKEGVAKERIIIDPGIGFAKTAAQSFELTRELERLAALGFPVLYAASQKSFIGKALARNGEMAPLEDRVAGTIVTAAYAMQHGASIVRVHDVRLAVQTRRIVEAIAHPEAVMIA